jgi:hypothetical protein
MLFAMLFAFESAGSNIEAKMPMIAMTTRSSTRVNEMRIAECGMRIAATKELELATLPILKYVALEGGYFLTENILLFKIFRFALFMSSSFLYFSSVMNLKTYFNSSSNNGTSGIGSGC